MISLTCTSCKKVLQIDDAFAGGVCRCQYCGTIQTVPAALKRSARPGAPPAPQAKTLYQKSSQAKGATGAENRPAGAVPPPPITRAAAPPTETKRKLPMKLIYLAGALVVMLLALVLFFALGPGAKHDTSATMTEAATAGPNFGGLPLDADSVVYLIDHGESSKYCFPELKRVAMKSIASLGPNRRFAVMFWNNGTEAVFPTGGMAKANEGQIDAAQRALDEVYAFGQTDLAGPLQQAVNLKPAAIVLVTGKGWDLDDAFAKMVDDIVGGTGVKVNCFTVGAGGSSRTLEALARRYGGEFREVTEDQLREAAR